jgi:hypothetical protein
MEGRELICRATGSAIPRSDLAHASQGPQWLNHPLVKQGTCGLCTSLQGLYKVDSSNAHPQQLGSTTSTNQTELLQLPELFPGILRDDTLRASDCLLCFQSRTPYRLLQYRHLLFDRYSTVYKAILANDARCSRAPYWQRVWSSPNSRRP